MLTSYVPAKGTLTLQFCIGSHLRRKLTGLGNNYQKR